MLRCCITRGRSIAMPSEDITATQLSTGYGQTFFRYSYWHSVWLQSYQRGWREVDEGKNNAGIFEWRANSKHQILLQKHSENFKCLLHWLLQSQIPRDFVRKSSEYDIFETLRRISIFQICEGSLFPIPSTYEKFINSGVRKWMSV